jgi:hypothetical protein
MDNKIKDFVKNYWNFYLRLEDEFLSTLKYVEFCKENYKTFSLEFLRLYLSVCSEIDVVGKVFAINVNSRFDLKSSGIHKWWYELQDLTFGDKKICEKSVAFRDVEEFVPWKNYSVEINTRNQYKCCDKAKTPSWWRDYNKVKHNRTGMDDDKSSVNYSKANLLNLCNAFGGLFVLEYSYLLKFANKKEMLGVGRSRLFQKETVPFFYTEDIPC